MGVFFKFLDTEFCFLMPDLKKESSWELFMEESQLRFSKNFYLPVYVVWMLIRAQRYDHNKQ